MVQQRHVRPLRRFSWDKDYPDPLWERKSHSIGVKSNWQGYARAPHDGARGVQPTPTWQLTWAWGIEREMLGARVISFSVSCLCLSPRRLNAPPLPSR